MGQTTSNIMKKVSNWSGGSGDGSSLANNPEVQCLAKAHISPFIYQKPSHMFVDCDGDVAHEFYEQQTISYKTPNSRKRKSKIVMKRVPNDQLTPLGVEKLSHPAINVDYPVVLCDATLIQR